MSTTASDDEFIQDDSDFRQHILQKLADFGMQQTKSHLLYGLQNQYIYIK